MLIAARTDLLIDPLTARAPPPRPSQLTAMAAPLLAQAVAPLLPRATPSVLTPNLPVSTVPTALLLPSLFLPMAMAQAAAPLLIPLAWAHPPLLPLSPHLMLLMARADPLLSNRQPKLVSFLVIRRPPRGLAAMLAFLAPPAMAYLVPAILFLKWMPPQFLVTRLLPAPLGRLPSRVLYVRVLPLVLARAPHLTQQAAAIPRLPPLAAILLKLTR